jgi:hypothetical protein
VIEFGETAVRETSGWASEWMAEVDKAEDAMDRIKRGGGSERRGIRRAEKGTRSGNSGT